MSSKSELLNKEKSLNEEPLKTNLVVLKKILKLRCPMEDEEVLEAERKLPSLKRKGGNQPRARTKVKSVKKKKLHVDNSFAKSFGSEKRQVSFEENATDMNC